ncbi:MAG: PD-(D/E)XK nuclease-like domain-containing protein [Pseudomonadota bacterium]
MTLQPGLYLDLPEDVYFHQDSLGSSDLKKLLRAPADWWYSSRHNPDREQADDSNARILGRALHALMLEGVQAYEARFAVEPDPRDYPGICKTTDEIKAMLKQCDIHVPSKGVKSDYVQIAVDNRLGNRVWDHLIRHHVQDVEVFGKTPIKAAQDRALRSMADIVENEPSVAGGLQSGIPEVSVFFERESHPGLLFRARFDSLSPNMTMDLKTLSNWKNRTVADMARRQIEEFEYDIQRRFYDEAREAARQFITQDKVFLCGHGPDGRSIDFLEGLDVLEPRIAKTLRQIADTDLWVWVWLFYQMRDDKAGKAPVCVPRFHLPEGEVWDEAGKKIDRALEHYQDFMSRFGPDNPWCHIEPALELEDADLAGLQYKTVL